MKTASVRLRLALWNVAVLALVLVVFAVSLRYLYEARLMANIDREMAHVARRFAGFRGPPGFRAPGPGFRGRPSPEPGTATRSAGVRPEPGPRPPPFGDPIRLGPRFVDLRDQLMPNPGGDNPWDPATVALAARGQVVRSRTVVEDRPVRVLSAPIYEGGQVVGVVQLAHSLAEVQDELGRLTRTLLTIIPLALAVAALGGAFLTDRALRPVRRVSGAAARIGASDLSERLPVTGRDEFAELAETVNGMLARLEAAFAEREQALARLAQSLEQQRRFTADASHELRTPLTIIKARTSLALEEERPAGQYRQALEAVDEAADTTIRIVQDLLLLARDDAGELRMERRPVPIGDLLERAAAPFRVPDAPSITVEVSPPEPVVSGDPHHLRRLFTNLLENAVRHTPPEGRIHLAAATEGDGVVVRVRDTGEGIPPEHLPHVCDRFYRVDAARSRRRGGSGLGLAICRSIAAAHDGSLAIESALGEGTSVTVRLPSATPLCHEGTSDA